MRLQKRRNGRIVCAVRLEVERRLKLNEVGIYGYSKRKLGGRKQLSESFPGFDMRQG